MRIGWVTVYFNTSELDRDRLKKQIHIIDPAIELFEIDNTHTEYGYAQGVNSGLNKALTKDFDLIVVSNPDINIQNITFNDLVNLANKFEVGGFAVSQNGKAPTYCCLDKWRLSGGLYPVPANHSSDQSTRYLATEFISGSFMCIHPIVFKKTGLFDESFKMYYEDVDFCLRAKQSGFCIGIDTATVYQHLETSDMNPQKKYWLSHNRAKILWKYGSIPQKLYELLRLPKTMYENFR